MFPYQYQLDSQTVMNKEHVVFLNRVLPFKFWRLTKTVTNTYNILILGGFTRHHCSITAAKETQSSYWAYFIVSSTVATLFSFYRICPFKPCRQMDMLILQKVSALVVFQMSLLVVFQYLLSIPVLLHLPVLSSPTPCNTSSWVISLNHFMSVSSLFPIMKVILHLELY